MTSLFDEDIFWGMESIFEWAVPGWGTHILGLIWPMEDD